MRALSAIAAGLWVVMFPALLPCAQESTHHPSLHGPRFKPLAYPIDAKAFDQNLSEDEREIYELIEGLVSVRLKQTLQVDDATMLKLFEKNGAASKQLTMLKWQRSGLREHMRWCLEYGQSEQGIKESLDLLLTYEENIADQLRAMVMESQPVLGITKSAQLYLFVDDFERFLATRVNEALKKSHPKVPAPAEVPGANTPDAHLKAPDEDNGFSAFQRMLRQQNDDVPLSQAAGEDVIKLVDALLVVRLAQALDIDKQETVRLFAHVGQVKDQLHELKWQIGKDRGILRNSILMNAPEDDIQKQLDDLLIEEKAVAGLVRDFVEGADKDISTSQSAKLYLFLGDFEAYIVDLLERTETN